MVTELTNYIGRPVYNAKGVFVGAVGNVVVDLPSRRIGSLLVTRTNPALVDGSRDVAVPYRWVSSLGDIVLLSIFPEHVTVVEETVKAKAEEKAVTA